MVQKIPMDFSRGKTQVKILPQYVNSFSSKISLNSTLAHNVEMKQMLRRLQGVPSGCTSCGGKGKK